MSPIQWRDDTLILSLRVQPKASRNRVMGLYGEDRLKLAITAPPVDGAANKAVCQFLAKQLGVAKSAASVIQGQTSRQKRVQIVGIDRTLAQQLFIKWGIAD
ncbi:MAG: YggU family protein [Magnetococcales bacterium]|nr:YggU family protein [Magnetococcales bacterium]